MDVVVVYVHFHYTDISDSRLIIATTAIYKVLLFFASQQKPLAGSKLFTKLS